MNKVIDPIICDIDYSFLHIRPLGAAGAIAVDICRPICFHDIES